MEIFLGNLKALVSKINLSKLISTLANLTLGLVK